MRLGVTFAQTGVDAVDRRVQVFVGGHRGLAHQGRAAGGDAITRMDHGRRIAGKVGLAVLFVCFCSPGSSPLLRKIRPLPRRPTRRRRHRSSAVKDRTWSAAMDGNARRIEGDRHRPGWCPRGFVTRQRRVVAALASRDAHDRPPIIPRRSTSTSAEAAGVLVPRQPFDAFRS